ncbi:unnamed protein product, partial [Ectocarpus fasciculatus]
VGVFACRLCAQIAQQAGNSKINVGRALDLKKEDNDARSHCFRSKFVPSAPTRDPALGSTRRGWLSTLSKTPMNIPLAKERKERSSGKAMPAQPQSMCAYNRPSTAVPAPFVLHPHTNCSRHAQQLPIFVKAAASNTR